MSKMNCALQIPGNCNYCCGSLITQKNYSQNFANQLCFSHRGTSSNRHVTFMLPNLISRQKSHIPDSHVHEADRRTVPIDDCAPILHACMEEQTSVVSRKL
jgi:hypothetical protein